MQSDPSTWVVLAHLLRPQGRKGELLAELLTDFPELLVGREDVFLVPPGFAGDRAGARSVAISSSWLPVGKNQGRVVLQIAGIETISDAETIAGLDVAVPGDQRLPLDEDSVYVSDLIGCDLFDKEVPVGEITEVHFPVTAEGTRLRDVAPMLIVQTDTGEEVLVPFVKAFVKLMDLAARQLTMELPAGLVDVNKKS